MRPAWTSVGVYVDVLEAGSRTPIHMRANRRSFFGLEIESWHRKESRLMTPIAPITQNSTRPKLLLSRVFWAGLILLILGTGPLLTVILLARFGVTKDPNPNPIGVGILTFLTFWPSVIMMIIGVTTSCLRYKSGAQKERRHQV